MIHPETGEVLDSQTDFHRAMRLLEERLIPIYQALRPIREAYAEKYPAAAMPPARSRTQVQERVARCPRCGVKLEKNEG